MISLAAAPLARAADFGTLGLDGTSFRSLASLSTPSSRLCQEPDEFVVHRTVVQSSLDAAAPGVIQVGVYLSGPTIELDNCGPRSGYALFTEVKVAGSMAYRCQLYRSLAPGTLLTLDIFRYSTPATSGVRVNGLRSARPTTSTGRCARPRGRIRRSG